jgi:hypothetical protein
MSSLPDVPEGLPLGLYNLISGMKELLEKLNGDYDTNDKAITYDDAIDIGLIDEDFEKV